MGTKIIRIKDLCKKLGISRTSIYRYMKLNKFPRPIVLSTNTIGWKECEIDEWVESRPRAIYTKNNLGDKKYEKC